MSILCILKQYCITAEFKLCNQTAQVQILALPNTTNWVIFTCLVPSLQIWNKKNTISLSRED